MRCELRYVLRPVQAHPTTCSTRFCRLSSVTCVVTSLLSTTWSGNTVRSSYPFRSTICHHYAFARTGCGPIDRGRRSARPANSFRHQHVGQRRPWHHCWISSQQVCRHDCQTAADRQVWYAQRIRQYRQYAQGIESVDGHVFDTWTYSCSAKYRWELAHDTPSQDAST